MADKNEENTFSMSVSEGGGRPVPSENDEEKSSSTEYETVTEASMNEENVENVTDDDGNLADREDSDYDDPYLEFGDVVIPNGNTNGAEASHQTAHEPTQPEYNTDVTTDEDPAADGYLADIEESDDDAPVAQGGVRYQLVISVDASPGTPTAL